MAVRDLRRRRLALVISCLIHAALLSPLLLVAPGLRAPRLSTKGDVELGLAAETDLAATHRPVSPGRAQTVAQLRATSESRPTTPESPRSASGVAAPGSLAPSTPGTGSGSGDPAAAGATAGDQAAVRRALQAAFACRPGNGANLDEETRAACRKRLIDGAAAMGEAKVDTIPPLKRAYYDAVVKAYQDIRHYQTPDSTLTHLDGAQGMYDQKVMNMPGRPPMAGCGMRFGGPKGSKPAGAPPHGLYVQLGPLVCGVTPPQGMLTEESVTPNADDVP